MLIKTVFAGSFTMTDAILIEYFLALYTEIIAFVCRLTGSGQLGEKKPFFCNTYLTLQIFYNFFIISIRRQIYILQLCIRVFDKEEIAISFQGQGNPEKKPSFTIPHPAK